jgi:hypothetical protein
LLYNKKGYTTINWQTKQAVKGNNKKNVHGLKNLKGLVKYSI